jgi:hypothetical protein
VAPLFDKAPWRPRKHRRDPLGEEVGSGSPTTSSSVPSLAHGPFGSQPVGAPGQSNPARQ